MGGFLKRKKETEKRDGGRRSFEGRRSREEKEGAFVKINGAELQRIKDLDFLHLHKKSYSKYSKL